MRFDSDIFQRFISGRVSDEEFDQVEQYLTQQPDVAIAEQDTRKDTLISVLREGYGNGTSDQVEFENGEPSDPSWEIVAQNLNRQFSLATGQLDISQYVNPAQSDEELGRIGNYRLLKQIGSGGMGIVFEAKPIDSDRPVAIKLMNPLLAANLEAAYRFRRESLAAARLKHENIVRITEVDQSSSIPFLVMELLQGENLAQRLRREGQLAPDKIVEHSIQVTKALEYAHALGILHRDIKPDNIWIDEHDQIKLLDFGLARTIDDQTGLTQTGAILGTPKYMSPEQAKGRSVDHRSDLFSLGSVMYEMLTGRPAFDRENFYSTILAVANDEVTDFESKRLRKSGRLHRIVTQLLHKNPNQRFESANTLREELEAVDPNEIMETQSQYGAGNGNNWKSILLGFAAAALLFALSIVIYVQTDRGTLVIDAGDDIEVSVVNETVKIRELGSDKEYTLKVGENRLPSGAYEIVVTDPATGLELSTTHFSLKRGGKELVNVGLKVSKTGVAANGGNGESLRGNPSAVGISPSAPVRSITEVLSPDSVGDLLAIKPGESIGMYSQFVDPVTLPNVATWTIVNEKRTRFSDLSFSMDGSLLAAGSTDNSVRIWEYKNQSRKLKHILPLNGEVKHVSWSPVQNVLLVSCVNDDSGSVSIWDVKDRLTIIDQASIAASSVAWSPSGTKVAIQSDHVEIFDVSQGRFSKLEQQRIEGEFSKKAWSQDERYFAVSRKKEVSKLEAGPQVKTATWETFVYDLVTQQLHHSFHDARNAAWSSHSNRLVFEHIEPGAWKAERVEFWDMSIIEKISEHQLQNNEEVVDWTSTFNCFAILQHPLSADPTTTTSSKLKILDFANVKQKQNSLKFDWTVDTGLYNRSKAVVGANRHWACPDYFDLNDHLHQSQTPDFWGMSDAVAMNQAGTFLVSFENNSLKRDSHRIAIYDSKNGKLIAQSEIQSEPGKTARISSIRLSKSGKYMYLVTSWRDQRASSNRQTIVKTFMYDVKNSKILFEFVDPTIFGTGQFFTPDEKRLVDVGKTQVNVLDVQTGEVIHKFVHEEKSPNSRNRFSSRFTLPFVHLDNRRLLWSVSEQNDSKIIECDFASGKTKTFLSFSRLIEAARVDRYSFRPFKLHWNEQTKRLIAVGRTISMVPRDNDRPGLRQESANELMVVSPDGDNPVILHSLKINGFEAPSNSAFSQSGNLFYYRVMERTENGTRQNSSGNSATEQVFFDLSNLDVQPRRFNVDLVGFKLYSMTKSGILFADQDRRRFKKVTTDGDVIAFNSWAHSNFVNDTVDFCVFQNGRYLNYFDHNGKRCHSVLLDNDYGTPQQHWFGKIGAQRFGPWVEKAPGEYLVTISKDPGIGIVTEPLDDTRSKYPELFQEK